MIEPIDIAIAAHKLCEDFLIRKNMSPDHDVSMHAHTTSLYAEVLNNAGVDATGERVIEAILAVSGWDGQGPWPGHPHPDLIIEYLNAHKN